MILCMVRTPILDGNNTSLSNDRMDRLVRLEIMNFFLYTADGEAQSVEYSY